MRKPKNKTRHAYWGRMWMLLALLANLTFVAVAQTVSVRGVVKDAVSGESLIGATIMEKGTTNGVSSGVDGSFALKVKSGATLVVSSMGYLSKEAVVNQSNSNLLIALSEDQSLLEEVVVIGYGTVKKTDATGSVSTLKADQLNKGVISSPSDLLKGKSAGVVVTPGNGQPGSAATIRIRGGSSLSASNDPLVVVDGLPISNTNISGVSDALSSINPSDIESFTVLKDASATAIYGSRASNGVIIITTKQGARGGASAPKFNIDLTASGSYNSKYVDVMSADELRQTVADYYGTSSTAYSLLGSSHTDWQKELYRTGFSFEANAGVTGSLKALETPMPYRFSVGYLDQKGILKTGSMKRTTASLNLAPDFFDRHLRVQLSARGMYIKNRFASTDAIGSAISYDPTQAVYDSSSDGLGGYRIWRGTDGNPNTIAALNPVALLDQRNDRSTAKRFVGNARFDYAIHGFSDLHLNLNLGLDVASSDGTTDTETGSEQSYHDGLQNGSGLHKEYNQLNRDQTLEAYLNYDKTFHKHSIGLMAGYSWQHFYTCYSDITVKQNDRTASLADPSYDPSEYFLVSFFGRANYVYDNRYMATFTVRRDGTSRFSKHPWGTFPSLALGWNIAQENFLKDNELVSGLKLRLSWGKTGQQDLGTGNYPTLGTYTTNSNGSYYYFGNTLITPITPNGYDENLKWETTTTYNAGIEFELWRGRLSGSIDVYRRNTTDLINNIIVPAGSNLSNYITTNVGSLKNIGVELELNAIALQTKYLTWRLGANIARNRNEITKLTTSGDPNYIGVLTGSIAGGTGNTIQINQTGKATNSFYVYEQVYDSDGKPIEGSYVDRDNSGSITSDDRYVYKKPAPDYTLGFNTTLSWKRFTFAMSAHASIGNYLYNNVESNNSALSAIYSANFIANRVAEAMNTKFDNVQYFSDYYVQNASFLKIDNITLSYRWDGGGKWLGSRSANLNFFATVQNVGTITSYKGIDPEIYSGIDYNIYPRPRTFLVGIKADF